MQHHSSNDFFLSLNFSFRLKFLKWSHQCIHSDLQEGDPISDLLLVLVGRHSTEGVLERI